LRGWQAAADEDMLTYGALRNRKLENLHADVQNYTHHQTIICGSNQGEWGVSEMQHVLESWEKHTEFWSENVQENDH
jgi:hypothetical protein